MESKTKKYILYAIGEIALVMIGILMALQVNIWNEDRKSKLELDKTIDNLEEDLIANYHLANTRISFIINNDSLLRLTIGDKLTIEDYQNNSSLRGVLVNWNLFTPQIDNVEKLIAGEKLISEDLKPLLQSVKLLKQQETWLNQAWEKVDGVVDENFKFLSEFPRDSEDPLIGINFRMTSPIYKQKAILYYMVSNNYANNITRYRARNLVSLAHIKRAKHNFTNTQMKDFLNSIGMKSFLEISCETSINDAPQTRTYRSHELAINGKNETVVLRLSHNLGKIIDSLVLKPYEIMPFYSYSTGSGADYHITAEQLDSNGNYIKKFSAVHNGYLLIE